MSKYKLIRFVGDKEHKSDWDLIMLAVDKIESIGHPVRIEGNRCIINNIYATACESTTKKEEVTKAVLSFMDWYSFSSK